MRDKDPKRFLGKGVLKVVENIVKIIEPELGNISVLEQNFVDQKLIDLDGVPNKSKLGANTILGVSL